MAGAPLFDDPRAEEEILRRQRIRASASFAGPGERWGIKEGEPVILPEMGRGSEPIRQDEAAAARATGGEETSLGLLPEEAQGSPGMARAAQIMGIIGAVAGKTPAGRGLQAASGMMAQQAEARTDMLARQQERMEQTERVIMHTQKVGRQIGELRGADPESPAAALLEEQYNENVPGGKALLDVYVRDGRSAAKSIAQWMQDSPSVRQIAELEGVEAAIDRVAADPSKFHDEVIESVDTRNMKELPDLIDKQFDWILANSPEKFDAFKKCGSTHDCWLKHIDKFVPDGNAKEDPEGALRLDTDTSGPERKSMVDTVRRNAREATNGKVTSEERRKDPFVTFVDATGQGRQAKSVRKGSVEADQLAEQGFVPGTITGSREEVTGLEPGTKKELERRLLTGVDALARLNDIEERFDPNFLTFQNRAQRAVLEKADKAGIPIPAEGAWGWSVENMTEGSVFRQSVFDDLNRFIKEMTGAQMSAQEADRLKKGRPNLDDSPKVFKAKFDKTMRDARLYAARTTLLLEQGFDVGGLSTSQKIEKIMGLADTRKVLLEVAEGEMTTLMGSGMDENAAFDQARENILSRYGVDLGGE